MKKFLLSILLILSLSSLVFADSNGIWHYAEDVRPGVFGSDEYSGNFSFSESVGIGTTSPSMKLEVVGDAGVPVSIGIKGALGQGAYISLSSDNANLGNRWSIGTKIDNSLYFFNAREDTHQLNIQNDGDVIVPYRMAIGALEPSIGFKLDVNGKIRMRTQTLSTDSSDTLATKKYVDDNAGGAAPVGTISAFNLASCPAGWVLANGGSGTPDLRGVFIRGLDLGRGIDTGRTLGSYQSWAIENIIGSFSSYRGISSGTSGVFSHSGATATYSGPGPSTYYRNINFDASNSVQTSSETRPANVALIYCMKTGSNVAEEVGILSVSPTKVFLTDNTKDFEVGGDIFMNGNKKVATEEYVDSKVGSSSICDFGGFYEINTPAVVGNNNCRSANLATGSCSCPSGYTARIIGQIYHNSPWDGTALGCYKC